MKRSNIMSYFISASCDISGVLPDSEQDNLEPNDPLQGVGNKERPQFYRIDPVVFAEPLKYLSNGSETLKDDEKSISSDQDQITIIDNVVVQKRFGKKYKKYHIPIEDSTKLCCTQSDCNRMFTTIKLLKAHIRKVHCADRNKYICDVCGCTFAFRYLLLRHASVHSGRTVQCNICAVVLSERTSLSSHMKTHTGIKPHSCLICNKSFLRKSTLDTHMKFVHREDQLLECSKCDEKFQTRSQWTRHTSTHHRSYKQDGAPS